MGRKKNISQCTGQTIKLHLLAFHSLTLKCNPPFYPYLGAPRMLLPSAVHESLSYPNFVREPLLDDMRPFFGPCEVLGTHH